MSDRPAGLNAFLRSRIVRVVALAALVLGGSVGYGLWYHLLWSSI
jgi:hypothetical protein